MFKYDWYSVVYIIRTETLDINLTCIEFIICIRTNIDSGSTSSSISEKAELFIWV